MSSVRTFRLHELGCKVNQYEGQLLREGLSSLGLSEAATGEPCDLFVVNSCSVTESGGAKSRQSVRSFLRKSPETRVLVTGCYAESDPDIVESLPGVLRAFGNQEKTEIVPWVARRILGMDGDLPDIPRHISSFAGHTRAFVKIQDGCRDHCSFCIIPSLRGDVTSREHDEIVEEMRILVAAGHPEIVLTGIHLGYYGHDRDERDAVVRLLRAARDIRGLERVKLSSIEVHEIDEDLVDLFAEDPVFVPHFHLPLQAGSDRTLRGMRRKYNVERFRGAVQLLRERLEEPAITTDLIVGFPGETEADFDESLEFCREMAFSKMHIFPYSRRRGTPATQMPDQVRADEIKRRKGLAAELDDAMAGRYRKRFLGRTVLTLVEDRRGPSNGVLTGLSDRFLRIDFEGPDELMRRVVPVEITAISGDRLVGRWRELATEGRS